MVFMRKLIVFLIPVILPLFLLAASSIFITLHYIVSDLAKNNTSLLKQTQENLELILNELDPLSLSFGANPDISNQLLSASNNSSINLDELNILKIIRGFFNAPAYARPYIHSVYVYFENNNKQLLTTSDGIVNLQTFYDDSWYSSFISVSKDKDNWSELRSIKPYRFDEAKPVITLYKKLYFDRGVIVLNINPDYIEKLLSSLKMFNNQSIFIVNDDNHIIFRNSVSRHLQDIDLKELGDQDIGMKVLRSNHSAYVISQIHSSKYKWKYISVIPWSTFYEAPLQIVVITLYLLLFTLAIGTAVTYILTRKNYNHMMNIIALLDSAKNGLPQPAITGKPGDEYSYIAQNVISTFIEQEYLKVQLSERKYKLQTMELLALKAQINPHFVYNTLEAINWKVIGLVGTSNDVNSMIDNLSDMMKYSLEVATPVVRLEEEIKNAISYIQIQKFRYKNKFEVLWEYETHVLQYKVVKLLLQPLIENCIYHGINEKLNGGCIKIRIKALEGFLRISHYR